MEIHFYQGTENFFSTHQETNENEKIEIIKNRISDFFNMKNVHFLFGSGTSCPAIPNMTGLYAKVKEAINADDTIKKEDKDLFDFIAHKSNCNLEEILGILYAKREFLKGKSSDVEQDNEYIECVKLILIIEQTIFNAINVPLYKFDERKLDKDNKTKAIIDSVLEIYKKFYQKIALRNKDLSRINVFTTNNDLFNETALDSLNIHYINGFNGGLNKYFNPAMFNYTFSKRMDTSIDRFEPVENMVYLYKLHGSINWIEDNSKSNSYFELKEIVQPDYDTTKPVLIYPTPMKQNKSLGSPYSDLFREFQHKLLEPNGVLFVIGYSFSDEHLNDIIYRALATNSTFNLVVINDIGQDKAICKISDNRIFRIWGDCDEAKGNTPIHYFEKIVNDLLPNLDAFKQKDILAEFVKQIKEQNNKSI
ncbi:MAG: SIR2 family protein [Paludibacteraceae bacterium]|nr:SIR2 family protein [Paludibacteraceae bacterium]